MSAWHSIGLFVTGATGPGKRRNLNVPWPMWAQFKLYSVTKQVSIGIQYFHSVL